MPLEHMPPEGVDVEDLLAACVKELFFARCKDGSPIAHPTLAEKEAIAWLENAEIERELAGLPKKFGGERWS